MKRTSILHKLTLFAMVAVVSACDETTIRPQAVHSLDLTPQEQVLVEKSNQFALNMFKASAKFEAGENVFISPLSIQIALAMLNQGAASGTRTEIEQVIGLSGTNPELANTYFKKLIDVLPNLDAKTKLHIANSIWQRREFDVLPEFTAVNKQYFNSLVREEDFEDSKTVGRINDWVSKNTNGKIPSIVDQLQSDLVMLLLNAVYFKGEWAQAFDGKDTAPAPFYLAHEANNVKSLPFMQLSENFFVTQNERFQAIRMPYGAGKYEMLALMPSQNGAAELRLEDLVDGLDGQLFSSGALANSNFTERKIMLSFPKFKFSYSNTLNDELQALGLTQVFTSQADLTRINPGGQLQVSEVKHKSFVEVNEEGTEAAAATSIGVVLTSMPMVDEWKFDRPFLLMVREVSSGLIIFMGHIADPSQTEISH